MYIFIYCRIPYIEIAGYEMYVSVNMHAYIYTYIYIYVFVCFFICMQKEIYLPCVKDIGL